MKKVVNAIILDNDKKKFLVIKRKSNEEIHPEKWLFPGGVIEQGESTTDALIRELKEETGLKLKKIIRKVSEYTYPRDDGTETIGESYLIEVEQGIINIGEELEDFKWVTLEEFEQMDSVEELLEEAMKAIFEENNNK